MWVVEIVIATPYGFLPSLDPKTPIDYLCRFFSVLLCRDHSGFFMALYYVLDERYANLALKIYGRNGTALPIL
jgi:hypothetical protein